MIPTNQIQLKKYKRDSDNIVFRLSKTTITNSGRQLYLNFVESNKINCKNLFENFDKYFNQQIEFINKNFEQTKK